MKKNIYKENSKKYFEMYKELVKQFRNYEGNYPKFMYKLLLRIVALGKSASPRFTKKQLCKDLGITYERYKFYMKYKNIVNTELENCDIVPNTLLNIVARFPKSEWQEIISKQKTYKLSKNQIVKLRTEDKFKDETNWVEEHNKINLSTKKEYKGTYTNLRSVRSWCFHFGKDLKKISVTTPSMRNEIYNLILETKNSLDEWLKNHDFWKIKKITVD